MIVSTLQLVPPWVFGLLAVLVYLGVRQSFPRSVTLRRSLVLPLTLLTASLAGVLSASGTSAPALAAWAAGVGFALAVLHGRVDVSAVRYQPREQRFDLPGSWVPLVLMLGLFSVKFAAGFALARNPALAASASFGVGTGAAYGLFSGSFLGRAQALWALARLAPPSPAA